MRLAVIGMGRVGLPLAAALESAGHTVSRFNRAQTNSIDLGDHDLAFLTVPDQELGTLIANIDTHPVLGLAHCAAQVQNQALGANVGMFHPLMSFRGGESPAIFSRCPVGVSGTTELLPKLVEIAKSIEAEPIAIDETHKEKYHLAAMFSSVFPYLMLMATQELGRETGLSHEQSQKAFGPLYLQALDHFKKNHGGKAITGPVSRGDGQTVRRHMEILQSNPELQQVYRHLTELATLYAEIPSQLRHEIISAMQ